MTVLPGQCRYTAPTSNSSKYRPNCMAGGYPTVDAMSGGALPGTRRPRSVRNHSDDLRRYVKRRASQLPKRDPGRSVVTLPYDRVDAGPRSLPCTFKIGIRHTAYTSVKVAGHGQRERDTRVAEPARPDRAAGGHRARPRAAAGRDARWAPTTTSRSARSGCSPPRTRGANRSRSPAPEIVDADGRTVVLTRGEQRRPAGRGRGPTRPVPLRSGRLLAGLADAYRAHNPDAPALPGPSTVVLRHHEISRSGPTGHYTDEVVAAWTLS